MHSLESTLLDFVFSYVQQTRILIIQVRSHWRLVGYFLSLRAPRGALAGKQSELRSVAPIYQRGVIWENRELLHSLTFFLFATCNTHAHYVFQLIQLRASSWQIRHQVVWCVCSPEIIILDCDNALKHVQGWFFHRAGINQADAFALLCFVCMRCTHASRTFNAFCIYYALGQVVSHLFYERVKGIGVKYI